MSCILYKLMDGKAVQERVPARKVSSFLDVGYKSTPEELLIRKKTPKKKLTKEEQL